MRGALDAGSASQAIQFVSSLPITVDRHPATAAELLALSLRFQLSAYDAAYLELAIRLRLPIATADHALRAAALAASVGIVA